METSSVNSSFFICLLLIAGFSEPVESQSSCPEPETRCGNLRVRFPFRIIGRQPEVCGYPGFGLQCSAANHPVFELPRSVKLNVKHIDYTSQIIQLYDPYGCLSLHFPNLTLPPPPPFQLKASSSYFDLHDYDDDFTIFNCSQLKNSNKVVKFITTCLSSSTYQVYAISSGTPIGQIPLLSCTKVFNISSVTAKIFRADYTIHLKWSNPMCKRCESTGRRCGFRNRSISLETACFEIDSSNKFLTIGLTAGSFLLAAIIVAIHYIFNSYKSHKESQEIVDKFLKDYAELRPTRYSYAEIKRITNQFKDKLGEGSFGTVFKGNISSEFQVAVKILSDSIIGNGEEFIIEIGMMAKVHHVNITRLVGFCAQGFRRALVYEYLPNGSLQNFINSLGQRKNFISWTQLQEIALGIAKGIEYLHHGCEKRILHFDIKPHNVLLDSDFTPKISDFGLAKLCSKNQSVVSMTNARGTFGYMAPEMFFRNFGNVSHKADVYSFGMLLLEMIGGRRITNDAEEEAAHIYYPKWIHDVLEGRKDLRIHEDEEDAMIAKKLGIVGLWCIQWHAVDRPSMQVVVQMLEGQEGKLPIPPNPFDSEGPSTSNRANVPARHVMQGLEIIQEAE
ncbi:hypothetical protein QN277_003350 [Acacia crassicarpa]|uniref:Protein kinase domain-containing protein n=1 Tax=Acacia crassicarpa TaxID=499986 RepID=A0AAE1J1U7_9FABA|nr:hypothetical protein QN277_003350 [Acacia crassicarpa]